MGPLGWQEMAFIFLLALLLFGPKKLPELGKQVAKGLAEFRRAQNELKATFEREMKSLERENESIKEVTNTYNHDTYNYDYSSYDSGSYGSEPHDSTANNAVTTTSASAPQGAQLTAATQEVDGSLFVEALQGGSTSSSASPVESQAVQG